MERRVNLKINHGDKAFYANSISVIFNPSKFVIDFRQNIPRIDIINEKSHETLVTEHNVVVMDPKFAKIFLETLKTSIENYEKKFGEIKVERKARVKEKEKDIVMSDYIG